LQSTIRIPTASTCSATPRYVIKAGEIAVEEGDIKSVHDGNEFVVKPTYDDKIEDYLKPVFQQQYTMSFENYPVEAERVHGLKVRDLPDPTSHDQIHSQAPAKRAHRGRGDIT